MEKTILIVDDEQDIVNFMEKFLRRFKILGIKATSGEEALQLYKKDKIDFVFLDVNMNGIDGLTVLAELKKINPDVRVFIITGSQGEEGRKIAFSLGAVDFITKPLDLNELKEKIEKYVLI